MYLNQIYWGNHSFGIQKASKRYFNKNASDLTIAEAAFLAGLLKAPEGYSPYTNYKGAKMRQKLVLEKMEAYGYITRKQRQDAINEKLKFSPRTQSYSKYPYFVQYVINKLISKYGDDIVRRGGLRVYTTLDPEVQEIAEKVIKEGVGSLAGRTGASQGALVSINVEKGHIQALVGGVDFAKSNFCRATQSRRAAGSSFKPIVYLTGFRTGKINPDSIVFDSPISFNTGWNVWRPKNWDGKYMGKMTVRRALTLSRNTPTVRIALRVGIDRVIETARLVGLKGEIPHNYSITLGSLGVSPLELATAFSTFARDGVYIEPTAIRRVENKDGKIIEINSPTPVYAVSPNFVQWLNSILIDVVEKGTGRNAKLNDRKVAGKTGTTDNVKDIWFTGYTPDTVTTIWLGNDKNLPLKGLFSSNCAQLWHIFSTEYYKVKKIPPMDFFINNNIPKKKQDTQEKPVEENNTKKPAKKENFEKFNEINASPKNPEKMFLNKDTKPKTEQNNKKTTALSDEEIERAYREYMNSDYSQLSTPRKQTTKTSPPEKTYPQAPVPQVNSNDSTNLQPATEEQ